MRIEVFQEVKDTKILKLKLIHRPDGVEIVAVNDDGDVIAAGHLLTFRNNGDVVKHFCVNRELGLKLDSRGALEITYP